MSICAGFDLQRTVTLISDTYSQSIKQENLKKIELDLASKHLAGKLTIGGGALGIAIAIPFFSIPVLGPLMSVILIVASVAAIIFGRDLIVFANNLESYSNPNYVDAFKSLFARKTAAQEFADKASANTFFISTFVNFIKLYHPHII